MSARPSVVVVGGGPGGMAATRRLRDHPVDVRLVVPGGTPGTCRARWTSCWVRAPRTGSTEP